MLGLLDLISQLGHGYFYGLVCGKNFGLLILWVNVFTMTKKYGELNSFLI